MERLQRLQIVQEVYFGDSNKIGELHDLQLYQRVAKRNRPPEPTDDPATPLSPREPPSPRGTFILVIFGGLPVPVRYLR